MVFFCKHHSCMTLNIKTHFDKKEMFLALGLLRSDIQNLKKIRQLSINYVLLKKCKLILIEVFLEPSRTSFVFRLQK